MLVFAIAPFVAPALAQPSNPGMGTWLLNVEKSKFQPGPAPKISVVTFQPIGNGHRQIARTLDADGIERVTEYTANYDEKPYPLKGSPNADTVVLKRLDALTFLRFDKKGDQEVMRYRRIISSDGRTFTLELKGTDAKGQRVQNSLVFDKQ
jgi:hypothetical protein